MVVGLGNPGPNYHDTRHNAGFWFLDRWAGVLGLSFRKPWFRPFFWAEVVRGSDRLVLVKPTTSMNHSGAVFPGVLEKAGATPDDLLVVFDQMDLPPGRTRMKPHGSHAGHNGLKSIDFALGGDRYHRLAVGIGRPSAGMSIVDHVLGIPGPDDRRLIDLALDRTVGAADLFWPQGWEPLTNAVNQRLGPP